MEGAAIYHVVQGRVLFHHGQVEKQNRLNTVMDFVTPLDSIEDLLAGLCHRWSTEIEID